MGEKYGGLISELKLKNAWKKKEQLGEKQGKDIRE